MVESRDAKDVNTYGFPPGMTNGLHTRPKVENSKEAIPKQTQELSLTIATPSRI